jgi:hypothetical protein
VTKIETPVLPHCLNHLLTETAWPTRLVLVCFPVVCVAYKNVVLNLCLYMRQLPKHVSRKSQKVGTNTTIQRPLLRAHTCILLWSREQTSLPKNFREISKQLEYLGKAAYFGAPSHHIRKPDRISHPITMFQVAGKAWSVELDGPHSNPAAGEIFRTCPHRPHGPPSLL